MTDRELLERAAKAAGIVVWRGKGHQSGMLFIGAPSYESGIMTGISWRPLADSGQALELAVKLRMDLHWTRGSRDRVVAMIPGAASEGANAGSDPMAATRRAIVRAAASLAKDQE